MFVVSFQQIFYRDCGPGTGLLYNIGLLVYCSNIIILPQVPKAADPLAKEREDVNKLVSDLIGGGVAPTSPGPSTSPVAAKTPDSAATGTPKQITPAASGRSKPVRLVVDQLAPVNIRPKVRKKESKQVCVCGVGGEAVSYTHLTLPTNREV